ncbi:hypothetical protein QA639_37625 [Bradyrhizobium pachyrhizi]|uniref:hypothetical protein n=1 Tax=Bradyrhizobium pachyrhizi TaxID=280333 RepID=UPI0024B1E375|nr:hypothetical protein [Bradyrhizobium pachyrhizi]WFU55210.1 hypothetical protein QA639_37625 [Bradyrhizobium pachyrhizi]
MNLDYCALPRMLPGFWLVVPHVIFEELDIIFANGRCEQLAEICQGIVKVFRSATSGDVLRQGLITGGVAAGPRNANVYF